MLSQFAAHQEQIRHIRGIRKDNIRRLRDLQVIDASYIFRVAQAQDVFDLGCFDQLFRAFTVCGQIDGVIAHRCLLFRKKLDGEHFGIFIDRCFQSTGKIQILNKFR